LLVTEDVEEDAEDLVLGAFVPGRHQIAIAALDGRGQVDDLPRLEDRQEDVVTLPRHVAPAHRLLHVERERVAIRPEQVEGAIRPPSARSSSASRGPSSWSSSRRSSWPATSAARTSSSCARWPRSTSGSRWRC